MLAEDELKEEINALKTELEALRQQHDADLDRILREIAYDRRRLAKLEYVDPTPSQEDRGDILRALLAANNGKMLVTEARQKMHLSPSQFSQLLASTNGDLEIKPYHLDRRQKVLILK